MLNSIRNAEMGKATLVENQVPIASASRAFPNAPFISLKLVMILIGVCSCFLHVLNDVREVRQGVILFPVSKQPKALCVYVH